MVLIIIRFQLFWWESKWSCPNLLFFRDFGFALKHNCHLWVGIQFTFFWWTFHNPLSLLQTQLSWSLKFECIFLLMHTLLQFDFEFLTFRCVIYEECLNLLVLSIINLPKIKKIVLLSCFINQKPRKLNWCCIDIDGFLETLSICHNLHKPPENTSIFGFVEHFDCVFLGSTQSEWGWLNFKVWEFVNLQFHFALSLALIFEVNVIDLLLAHSHKSQIDEGFKNNT